MRIITVETEFKMVHEYHVDFPYIPMAYRVFENGERVQFKWTKDNAARKVYTDKNGEYIKINACSYHKTVKVYKED